MSGLSVLSVLALLWLVIILGHRHHRREEANRQGVANHIAELRSVGPMPDHWLDRREREGRA